MWISRKSYDDLRIDTARAVESARVLEGQNRALTTTLDWMRVRMTQVEHERAQLLYNFTGVKLPVPVVERTPAPGPEQFLATTAHMHDVGDELAGKLGISWAEDGAVTYK